jgi:hypothetical protein
MLGALFDVLVLLSNGESLKKELTYEMTDELNSLICVRVLSASFPHEPGALSA